MLRARVASLAWLGAMLALVAPAAGMAAEFAPIRVDEIPGDAWAAYRLRVGEGEPTLKVEIWTIDDHAPVAARSARAVWYQTPDHVAGSWGTSAHARWAGSGGVHVDVSQGMVADTEVYPSPDGQQILASYTFWPLAAGEYSIVPMSAHGGDKNDAAGVRSRFVLLTDGDIEVRAASVGEGAYFLNDDDAQGGVNVSAHVPYVRALVAQDAHLSASASRSMFAWFDGGGSDPTEPRLSYTGPDGGDSGSGVYFLGDAPPGAYDFRIDESIGGIEPSWLLHGGTSAMVFLLFADVELLPG